MNSVQVLDEKEAFATFEFIKESVAWEPFKSRGKLLRLGNSPLPNDVVHDTCIEIISKALRKYDISNVLMYGVYLNLYENGRQYAPMHSHETQQIVVSLGAERILKIGSKDIILKSGEAVLFGTERHGVPVSDVNEPRISIAAFFRSIN